MAYPEHHLLQFGGGVGDALEEWSCGIRMALYGRDPLPGDDVDEESFLDDQALPALQAWFSAAATLIAPSTTLQWVKFNEIGPDGRYLDPAQSHERTVNYVGGSTENVHHPLQVCLVLSWRTDAAVRGPASMGRIYMPRPSVAVDLAGDLASAKRVGVMNTTITMLNTLDIDIDPPVGGRLLRPSIVSNIGAGHANQIDTVLVDSQLDIQRRRAYSASREFSSGPVLY